MKTETTVTSGKGFIAFSWTPHHIVANAPGPLQHVTKIFRSWTVGRTVGGCYNTYVCSFDFSTKPTTVALVRHQPPHWTAASIYCCASSGGLAKEWMIIISYSLNLCLPNLSQHIINTALWAFEGRTQIDEEGDQVGFHRKSPMEEEMCLIDSCTTNSILMETKYFQTLTRRSENVLTIVGRDAIIVGSGRVTQWYTSNDQEWFTVSWFYLYPHKF
jgi:hypothetical protein